MSLGTINSSMEGGESRKIRDENSSGNASRPPRKNGLTTSGFSAELEVKFCRIEIEQKLNSMLSWKFRR